MIGLVRSIRSVLSKIAVVGIVAGIVEGEPVGSVSEIGVTESTVDPRQYRRLERDASGRRDHKGIDLSSLDWKMQVGINVAKY